MVALPNECLNEIKIEDSFFIRDTLQKGVISYRKTKIILSDEKSTHLVPNND